METILNFIKLSIPRAMASAATEINISSPGKWTTAEALINDIFRYFTLIAASTCFIIFAIGGLHYIYSTGSPDQVNKAKDTMIWSAIGFFVFVAGYAIVRLVGGWFGYDKIF
ncbi:MAG: hypothetical protein WCW17_01280 [Patescibacteria group bacterium]|jgi:hypothetical protein